MPDPLTIPVVRRRKPTGPEVYALRYLASPDCRVEGRGGYADFLRRFLPGVAQQVTGQGWISEKQSAALWKLVSKTGSLPGWLREAMSVHQAALCEAESAPPPYQPWEAVLDLDPDDWAHRLVYADWLDEQARDVPLSLAQRWMGTERVRPFLGPSNPDDPNTLWGWWWPVGRLPDRLWLRVEIWPDVYPGRMAAERALGLALAEGVCDG